MILVALCYTFMHYFTTNEWLDKKFENGRKNMPFKIEDGSVYLKYNEI